MDNKVEKRKISYSSLLAIFILLILLGVGGMIFSHGDLEIHKSGWSVEGTIVSYEVKFSPSSNNGKGKYRCFFKCEYADAESGKHYSATTYYPVANETESKEWCESKIGTSIELVIDKYGHCMAERDMTFDLIQWIFLPRGIFIIVGIIGIIVIIVKKYCFDNRKKLAENENIEEQQNS